MVGRGVKCIVKERLEYSAKVTNWLQARRLKWLDQRMDETRFTKRVLNAKPDGWLPSGRLPTKWQDLFRTNMTWKELEGSRIYSIQLKGLYGTRNRLQCN
ncbi:unnamed protein product [Soboliphyme baturini]|uniref:Transposase n=1 Tax=Soboliphyme baturini TaxID=241478 RepID=A0A183IB19_9BILA|nr:unnamed protein product [Soboliphyme baturini]